ncbi:MAG TPA: S8 family serine peptidase [Gaiellaceae bacterium]|nr:S8 family serine peptidase [Gaiellaceae bacterium]
MRRGLVFSLLCLVVLATGSARAEGQAPRGELVEIVVALSQKPLGTTRWAAGRQLQARTMISSQDALAQRIESALPDARIRWRYRLVANGMAVVVRRSQLARLTSLPGVAKVYPSVRYRTELDRSPQQIGAPTLWGPGLTNAGQGMKIAIIDEGVDQTHPFFSPAGYTMPAGFPKGQAAYTSAKVIVARAFPPPRPTWRNASRPFDPELSSHGTHVAGIAAGNANTLAEGVRISGVAPRAYLGNYKALTIPTDADVGLDGNSPELAAAIEAAVADGMDVINMSLGEPEIEPSRDIVVQALAAAARAGVVPVVAAGNDFDDFGRGSVSSPGSAPDAITVGAVTTTRGGADDVVASFSSSGPTPLSLRLKPEVSAPGVSILSAAPGARYATLSGTSMASPHVAGGVALLLQRHPTWTPAQVKSALALTGDEAFADDLKTEELSTVRGGGGVINLPRADNPLVFAAPVALSFGLVGADARLTQSAALTDAGGGAGDWAVTVERQTAAAGVTIAVPPIVTVPGSLPVSVTTTNPVDAELTGHIVLTRGSERRRISYWFRTGAPALGQAARTVLRRAGIHSATTKGGSSRVARYSYPERPVGLGFSAELPGPERVFRVTLARAAANFGVVITSRATGVRVEPRIVHAGDERRLTGYPALPLNLNPYLRTFGDPVLASGAILPAAGGYDVVFDSPSAARAGKFSFRFWVNDTKPPSAVLRAKRVRHGTQLIVASSDGGSGIDPASVVATVDGAEHPARFAGGRVRIPTGSLTKGSHVLRLQISDYQESRNMENVGPILPNTRILTTPFVVT